MLLLLLEFPLNILIRAQQRQTIAAEKKQKLTKNSFKGQMVGIVELTLLFTPGNT